MAFLSALWLPILLSAVLVFFVSALIHMVLKYHNSDYHGFANEDAVRAAIRSGNPAPGQYVIPYCSDMKAMESPEMKAKYAEGPVGMLLLKPAGQFGMGKQLVQWFIATLVISFFIAYIAYHTLPAGTPYLGVFRVVGAIGFLAYGAGSLVDGIWMGKPWSVVTKEVVDALLYGLVTAGTFGWLWPK
jgi:hypothetical protein